VAVPTFEPGVPIVVLNNQPIVAGTISQPIGLHRTNSDEAISVTVQFSADPGAFQIDLQTSDTNTPNAFVSLESLDTGELNASFYGRFEVSNIGTRYIQLAVISVTNAVNCTITVS
jgi:hypothetical protein